VTNDHDELLTVTEVADLLRVPVATVRWWRHKGDGPRGFRLGRHVVYQLSDVTAYIARQRGHDGPDDVTPESSRR
jgi:excisionase family DNA binding protein